MLRFFEPEAADSMWPAAGPPAPQRHCIPEHRIQGPLAAPGRRFHSALTTVDIVKGRWFPMAGSVSRPSSPRSSSSGDSINSFGGSRAFHLECIPSLPPFQAGDIRSSSVLVADHIRRRIGRDESDSLAAVVRNPKRQKAATHYEAKLRRLPPPESTSFSSRTTRSQPIAKTALGKKSQKLGDKVTALQQLVSPFGKTDTASVLHEATVYIKALHEQIRLLSRPRFESSSSDGIQGNAGSAQWSLRARGLCMVQITPVVVSFADQEPLDCYVREQLPWGRGPLDLSFAVRLPAAGCRPQAPRRQTPAAGRRASSAKCEALVLLRSPPQAFF
ncbi:Transcription factor bHLH113 [Apostasia shenzhenica]|uniref:Transcription factor bHLH113 n=1 Tax=Apostasia shenzhenica TaxID=1088818 RepID=A0A2I0ALD1_9ASPA|nr:Transcription factor bHLH113 [Apostasia shenzhenica]